MQIEKGSQTAALFVFGGEGAVYGFAAAQASGLWRLPVREEKGGVRHLMVNYAA
ncbi:MULTISPECIES: hypothetical protein [Pantoea]|uniref:hypothetical protein n=1 Tax=Pantoea TaxID=53335 RepID=UPI0013156DC1|nr:MULTISPECIES: hypothetical protein [Pantoea]